MDIIIISFKALDKEVLVNKLKIIEEQIIIANDFSIKLEELRDKIKKNILEIDKWEYDSD
jgi:hypothetical protein